MRKEAIQSATSSDIQNYGTPWGLYRWLDWTFHFTRDLAAEAWNAKHRTYWTAEDNALTRSWRREVGYLNCEYRQIVRFMRHAKAQAIAGGVVCSLVATRTDTRWYREATEDGAGRLISSEFVPETRVWWTVWADLIVGVHHVAGKVPFAVPPGTRHKKTGELKKPEPSFFPSTLIVFAARARYRLVRLPQWRRPLPYDGQGRDDQQPRGWLRALDCLDRTTRNGQLDLARGWPPLTYGMPEL